MTPETTDPDMVEAEAEVTAEPEAAAPDVEESETEESALAEAEDTDVEDSEAEDSEAVASEAEDSEAEDSEAGEAGPEDSGATDFDNLRLVEALLFASAEPLAPAQLARFLPEEVKLDAILNDLESLYANRGVNLVKRGGRWAFRTAEDLAPRMELENKVVRKLSRVGLETLAVIAYHQPVTRAEIEEIRGVALSKGTLDTLLEIGWIRPKGRRKTPGRPVTWGTSESFLDHFGLETLDALPGVEELKAAGLLDARPALTALSDRGLLPGAGEITPEEVEGDDDDDAESDIIEGSERELLEETFGEDLLPQEVDLTAPQPETGSEAETEDDGAEEEGSEGHLAAEDGPGSEPMEEDGLEVVDADDDDTAVLAGDAVDEAPEDETAENETAENETGETESGETETGDAPQRSTG